MSKLDELEAAAKAATPGPWEVDAGLMLYAETDKGTVIITEFEGNDNRDEANAAFIASANPATILAIVEVVRAAKEMRKSSALWNQPSWVRDFDAALAKLEDSKQ